MRGGKSCLVITVLLKMRSSTISHTIASSTVNQTESGKNRTLLIIR